MDRSQTRSRFITTTAAAAGAITSFPVFIPQRGAAADVITLGVTEEITGVYADFAKSEIAGIQMAVDERNAKGGVMGRQVKLAIEDNANNPGIAVEKARKLIGTDKVPALIGCINSAVAQATSNVAFDLKVPYIDSGGHTDTVTGSQCHWTTFRTCHSTWMETHATGYSIEKKFGKKWYLLAPDYAFGHSLVVGFKDLVPKLGIQIVGEDYSPLGTTDFSAYLTKVLAAKPDCFIAMVQGDDLINCLKQADSAGLLKRIPVAGPQAELEVFWSLPKEAQVGYWGYEWYYKGDIVLGKGNTYAANFVKEYTARRGSPPTARSAFGYITAARMMEGFDQAKSTDPVKVCKAIEDKRFNALCVGESYYRGVDHQLIWPMWFGPVRAGGTPSDPKDIFDITDVQPGEKIEKTAEEQSKICNLNWP